MPMQAESLEILEKADVAPAQARAIVRAIEIEIAGAADTLATKQDLFVLKQDLLALKQDSASLKQDFAWLKQDFASLKQDLAMLESRLESRLDNRMATLQTELARQGGELRAELHRSIGGVTRRMYTAVLGQMAVLLGFAYFFATHLR
jgi:hypothetical protein